MSHPLQITPQPQSHQIVTQIMPIVILLAFTRMLERPVWAVSPAFLHYKMPWENSLMRVLGYE